MSKNKTCNFQIHFHFIWIETISRDDIQIPNMQKPLDLNQFCQWTLYPIVSNLRSWFCSNLFLLLFFQNAFFVLKMTSGFLGTRKIQKLFHDSTQWSLFWRSHKTTNIWWIYIRNEQGCHLNLTKYILKLTNFVQIKQKCALRSRDTSTLNNLNGAT